MRKQIKCERARSKKEDPDPDRPVRYPIVGLVLLADPALVGIFNSDGIGHPCTNRTIVKKHMIRILALFLLGAAYLPAQDWARQQLEKSPRHREWVTVKHDGRSVETFVAYPESKNKTPVVLIIHEIFGLSDWVQDLADQVAAAGYIAVAPDLLSGMGPNGGRTSSFAQGEATQAVSHLNPDQVTADLKAAADYGLKLPAAQEKLFVAGFCWGGGQTFRFATNRPGIAAAFVFYGPPPMKPSKNEIDMDALKRISAPVYGF